MNFARKKSSYPEERAYEFQGKGKVGVTDFWEKNFFFQRRKLVER